MRLVDRYIGTQVLIAAVMGILVLSLVIVLGQIFKEVLKLMVQYDLPLGTVLQFISFVLPFSLTFTIPWGVLTAVLLVFGRLSADNELGSLRMAGLSTPRICLPVFVIAFGFVLTSFAINTFLSPKAKAQMNDAMFEMARQDPLKLFQEDKLLDLGETVLHAGKRTQDEDGEESLDDVYIIYKDSKGFPIKYAFADSMGGISSVNSGREILISLKNFSTVDRPDDHVHRKAPSMVKDGPSGDLTWRTISLEKLQNLSKRFDVSALTTPELLKILNGPVKDLPIGDQIEGKKVADAQERLQSKIKTEIHKRYSFSLATFTFVLLGIPLGITAQRRETSIGFVISLIVAIAYFVFIALADNQKDSPDVYPHLLMWIPNAVFLALGFFLFWRLSKK